MGSIHVQMKTLKKVDTEMTRHVLARNLNPVTNIIGTGPSDATLDTCILRDGSPSPDRTWGLWVPIKVL